MNTVFKVVFNAATRTFTAASEAAKSKRVAATVVAGVMALGAGYASASDATSGTGDSEVTKTTNNANDLFVASDGTSSNLHAVAGKVIVIDDQLAKIHGRGNEVSDRAYRTELGQKNAIHYDGDKVSQTAEDMKDKQTDSVMRDRKGNAIKKAVFEKGTDSITFRGDNGTTLKKVADGEVSETSKEAVNGSQLHSEQTQRQTADTGLVNALGGSSKVANDGTVTAPTYNLHNSAGSATTANNVGDALTNLDGRTVNNTTNINKLQENKAEKTELKSLATTDSVTKANEHADNVAGNAERNANSYTDQSLKDKVNTSEFKADQDRQDNALTAETSRAQTAEGELNATKADRSELKTVESNANRAHDRIDGVQSHQKVQDAAINTAQSTADAGLTVGNAAYKQSQANAEDIQYLNHEVNAVDTRSAQRAQKAEQNANAYTDGKVAGLKQDIKKVDRDAKAGIAAAIALGQLQAPIHAGKGNVSVGAGNWKGANAVSVGGGYRWNNDQWSAKGGVSFSDHGNAIGGSVAYEF